MRFRGLPWLASALLAGAVSAVSVGFDAFASEPPLPTEFRLYGTVSLAGGNVAPTAQPVIALIAGRPCGWATTFLNGPLEPDDPGRTVYVIDVAADGTRANEVAGCGRPGAFVQLYLPMIKQLAPVAVPFGSGAARFDLSLGARPLTTGSRAIMIARGDPE